MNSPVLPALDQIEHPCAILCSLGCTMRLGALYGATRIARSPPSSPCPKVPPFAPTINSCGSLTHAAFASLELVLHDRVAYASVPAMPGPRALSVDSVTGERRPSPVRSRGTPHHRFVFASLDLVLRDRPAHASVPAMPRLRVRDVETAGVAVGRGAPIHPPACTDSSRRLRRKVRGGVGEQHCCGVAAVVYDGRRQG